MRPQSRQEIFLQKRLTLCATLLYDASQIIAGRSSHNIPIFLLECEHFFSETKSLLAAEIAREEEKPVSPISVRPAEQYGAVWTSPGWNGWQPASPANLAAQYLATEDAPVPSSNPCPGGTTETPHSLPNFSMRIKLSFSTKPKGT